MALYCDDGLLASIPPPGPPAPRPKPGTPWTPAPITLCQRCGQVAWKHRSFPPVIADDIDRVIYAAAFVAAIQHDATPSDAVRSAEAVVDLHRRARSGT